MDATDVPNAALQRVTGVGRTDFSVTALRVANFSFEIFSVENTLRILDRGQKRLQRNIGPEASAAKFDAGITGAGVLGSRLEMITSHRHAIRNGCPFDRRHDTSVRHGVLLPLDEAAIGNGLGVILMCE